jgi:hypothetical protein
MLQIAAGLVGVAGVQLFVLSEHTARYFAWTIKLPLTAALLGAGYWASGVLELLLSRERRWANARAGVPAVWIFTTLTLVATLLHLDVFRAGSFWAWAWFAIYGGVPIALGVIYVMQLRTSACASHPDREATTPLPTWLCAVLGAQLALLLPVGLALFLTPTRADDAWPWALTPLTGRALGAWLIGWSVVVAQALWERVWRRVRVSLASFGLWGALALLAVARYSSALDWDAGRSWIWLGVAGSIVGVGAYSVAAGWGLARGGVAHGDAGRLANS